jgi:hypothetical protein
MSDKIQIAKAVVKIVAGLGVSKITRDIIANNVNVENTWDQIQVISGTLVVTGMVAQKTGPYIDSSVDNIADWFENRVQQEEKPEYKSNR